MDEDNVEVRRRLIAQVGYERICDAVYAIVIDTWRECILLIIDGAEKFYNRRQELVRIEPIILLKMTCPSTAYIHILRVPLEMVSAEAAITWVNHGIYPVGVGKASAVPNGRLTPTAEASENENRFDMQT